MDWYKIEYNLSGSIVSEDFNDNSTFHQRLSEVWNTIDYWATATSGSNE